MTATKTYFVAKTPTSGFIGQKSYQDIVDGVRKGTIKQDYVVVESDGPSYAELVKRTDVQWESVAKFLDRPRPPEPEISRTAVDQNISNTGKRYQDAYLIARATDTIGSAIKVISIVLGIAVILGATIIGSQTDKTAPAAIAGS